MKTTLASLFAASAFVAATTSASAQTLGSAANYDIFVQNRGDKPVLELKDANQLFGQVAISNNATLKAGKDQQNFDGTIFLHTGGKIENGDKLNPSGGIQSSSSIDAAINQANVDLDSYVNYLQSLTATESFGELKDSFSYTSMMSQTVLDFTTIDLDKEMFTLNGSMGGTDQFIIRISEDFEFKETDLVLNNLSPDNVIFYLDGDGKFDLHKSADRPEDFMKFSGTVIAPDGEIRLGEVDFTGRVYGSELKLGSGFEFNGTTIPEPSSSLLVLVAGVSGLLIRRRKH